MARPRAVHDGGRPDGSWRYLILDGYVDEPAELGVPPYLSPTVRSLAGGLISGGAKEEEIGYLTVDQWRVLRGSGSGLSGLKKLESIILIAGCVVPGRYLRGTPISPRETIELFEECQAPLRMITGAAACLHQVDGVEVHTGDPGILGNSIATGGKTSSRARSIDEWNLHLILGAFITSRHPDHPSPLICEIETSVGCPRFVTGGCSFCMEPRRGPVQFREPEKVIEEVRELSKHGVENIRIGGQSDLVSYMSTDVGRSEVPEPDPEVVSELMLGVMKELHNGKGVKEAIDLGGRPGIDTGIVHTDNANPAVIAEYPERSLKALTAIKEGSTGGSVLALGLESSDPLVKERNNLNSTPEQTLEAVRIMNTVGKEYAPNGLPELLPGLNFLGGLSGQTVSSFGADLDLLKNILKERLLLRRINIRRVIGNDTPLERTDSVERMGLTNGFRKFKDDVRSTIDPQLLSRMLPTGNVLKGIHTEAISGNVVFGRQIGSYPILVGIPHRVGIGTKVDIAVTEVSSRSITGFVTPFDLSGASFRDLSALPGIGKRRAASIFRAVGRGDGLPKDAFKDNEWVLEHLAPF